MSQNNSDRDEQEILSSAKQPIDKVGPTKENQGSPKDDQKDSILSPSQEHSFQTIKMAGEADQQQQISSTTTGGGWQNSMELNEDDDEAAIDDMDELVLLKEQMDAFEQRAFETKKRINNMDLLAYKSQLLPQTLRQCYQVLQKSWAIEDQHGEQKDAFDQNGLDELISASIKTSGSTHKEFGKFKGEFFALCEPILNKDISQLSPQFVQSHVNKQQDQVEKLSFIEDHVSQNDGQIEELKHKFETFQMDKFEEKIRQIEKLGQEVKEMVEEADQKEQNASLIFKDTKGKLKEVKPQTRDQRSKHSDVLSKLKKSERQYSKWKANFDTHSSKQSELHDQISNCQKIVENMQEMSLKTMLAQSKKLQQLVDCSIGINKFHTKLVTLTNESSQILDDTQQLDQQCHEFFETLQSEIGAEYEDIINKIREFNQNLEDNIQNISESLNKFEIQFGDMKISDKDLSFLNKETMKCRSILNSMDSQRNLYVDATDAIENKLTMDDTQAIGQQDVDKLRLNLKNIQKQVEVELPKIQKQINNLEQYGIRSLKNQMNADQKLTQTNISKVKKSYEEFIKQLDKLKKVNKDCEQKVNGLTKKFDSQDIERINQIQEIQEQLQDHTQAIIGPQTDNQQQKEQPQNDDQQIDSENNEKNKQNETDESLQSIKSDIFDKINVLTNHFSEITKVLRDTSGDQLKEDGSLNDLIFKNKQILMECDQIHEIIDGAKQKATDIQEQLQDTINNELLEELLTKYQSKENLIEECKKLSVKSEKLQSKLILQLTKQIELIQDLVQKLEVFNPINSPVQSSTENNEFQDEILKKIDETNEHMEDFQKLKEDSQLIIESIEQTCLPIAELGEREVLYPEIEEILDILKTINTNLIKTETDIANKSAATSQLQKEVKEIIRQEIEGRLQQGQKMLDQVEQEINNINDKHNQTRKKLKNFRNQIEQSKKKHGHKDASLLEKFEELMLETNQYEEIVIDVDNNLTDQKRRKSETRRQIEDLYKAMQDLSKFKTVQLDQVFTKLDELTDMNEQINEKLYQAEAKMEIMLKNLDDLVSCYEKTLELQQAIKEAETEMEEDLANLSELLDRLPTMIEQLQTALGEMSASAGPTDDFCERKDELTEKLDKLEDIKVVFEKSAEDFNSFKHEKVDMQKQKEKANDNQQLQKILDILQENNDTLSKLFTESLDIEEQLKEINKYVGDCSIPMLLTKRKNEFKKFTTKGDRLKKELVNLQKARQSFQGGPSSTDEKIPQMIKEIEQKMQIFDTEKQDLKKIQLRDLDTIKASQYDDIGKASELLKIIRDYKYQVFESDQKLKDLEELLNETIKRMTELDLENSIDLLGLKALELQERLQESRQQLMKIKGSGECMDGNTSTSEEEDFISVLKNQIPEVFDKIETNLQLLVEIEKRDVPNVKESMSINQMNQLREKLEMATVNVEELEELVIKLNDEILEWNAQKKLYKRDSELDDAKKLLSEQIEFVDNEQYQTQIHLKNNKQKQDQNRNKKWMKDGKEIDLVQDLINLEDEMLAYLKEIHQLRDEVEALEVSRGKLFTEFNKQIPKMVIEERQRKAEQNQQFQQESKLKRPPNLLRRKTTVKEKAEQSQEQIDIHKMLTINCNFRSSIKKLSQDIQNVIQRRKELEEKYHSMRVEVFKMNIMKGYKPVEGDEVDKIFADHLNKAKVTIDVQRTSASNYMFGSKKISAKIINGRLVIRVGGGFMNAEEFIEQYSRIERKKMIYKQNEEREQLEKEAQLAAQQSIATPTSSTGKDLNQSLMTPKKSGLVKKNIMKDMGDALKQKYRDKLQQVKPGQGPITGSKIKQSFAESRKSIVGGTRQSFGGPDNQLSLDTSMRSQKDMLNRTNTISGALNRTMTSKFVTQSSTAVKSRNHATKGMLSNKLSSLQTNMRKSQASDGTPGQRMSFKDKSVKGEDGEDDVQSHSSAFSSARGKSSSPVADSEKMGVKTPSGAKTSRIGQGFTPKAQASKFGKQSSDQKKK